MSNYFVSGASGFIGRHLVRSLLADGGSVFILVRPLAEVADLEAKGAVVFRGDFTKIGDLEKFFPGLKIDVVFHLAALVKEAGVPDSLFYRVNVEGTKNLLKIAKKYGVGRFVQVSTTGVLGDVDQIPAPVDAPYKPVDIYQKTKTEAEVIVRQFGYDNNLEVVIARPGAVYGPGDRRFLKLFKMVNRGFFAMLGRGQNYLHPVYIDDLVAGLKLCGTVPGIGGRIYHLAGLKYVTVKEWTEAIAAALNKKIRPLHLPLGPILLAADIFEWLGKTFRFEPPIFRRRIEFFVKNRAFDISVAVAELGYFPGVTLKEGLKKTVSWYRQNKWL
jgi:nucleoside-diphosphate-sugar epimerase